MTTSIVETALSNADISSQAKAIILGHIQEQIEASKRGKQEDTKAPIVDNVNLVSIPSLGEFGELLDIVSPISSNGLFWKQEDLILLNMGKNVSIIFYDYDYLKHKKTTSQATAEAKETQEKEKKEKEKEKESEKKKETDSKQDEADNNTTKILRLSKVVLEKQETNGGMMSTKERSTLTMNSIDEFSCLLLGCCIALSNINGSSRSTFEDTMFLNVERYLGKAYTDNEISYGKKEIKSILPLLIDIVNNNNSNNNSKIDDQSLMVRLAMIFSASLKNLTQLSFVKNYIKRKTKEQGKEDDTVVTNGDGNSDENADGNDLESKILEMKRVIDGSLFRMMIYQIGCFIDLYNLIDSRKENAGNIIAKFLTYFYFFENVQNSGKKTSFLLTMKHDINNNGVLSISRQLNDGGNLYKVLLKYVESNETFNEKFGEYGKFFNEMSSKFRTKMTRVEFLLCLSFPFFFFLFFSACLDVCFLTFLGHAEIGRHDRFIGDYST